MKKNDEPIALSFRFNNTIEQLWKAMTSHTEMLHWYFENIPDFKPEIGFKTSFVVKSDTRKFTHDWEVIEVEPLSKIAYKWKYPEYEGDSYVRFKLSEDDSGCMLDLDVVILEDFSDEIPEFRRENCIGGWDYFLDRRLRAYLESIEN